jgi:predicted metal-binding transcription factor (methanogenesis marker protein 9)
MRLYTVRLSSNEYGSISKLARNVLREPDPKTNQWRYYADAGIYQSIEEAALYRKRYAGIAGVASRVSELRF